MNKHYIIFVLLTSILLNSCKKDRVDGSSYTYTYIPPTPVLSRDIVNAKLTPFGTLSQARTNIGVGFAGNKMFFAGGVSTSQTLSSRVDIFDFTTNTWSTAELSQPRAGIATAVLDKKIFFGGGSRVDIYDTETNVWTTANLSGVEATLSAASDGNKVVFASGVTAHINDGASNSWTTAALSERPGEGFCCRGGVAGISATVIGNAIYFAGGVGMDVHNAIDIYNTPSNTWSKSTLSEYKGYAAGIAVDNVNYWAGGFTLGRDGNNLSDKVEIRDVASGSTTFGSLFQGNASFSAVHKNDTIVFFTGAGKEKNKFDIYDIRTKKWSIGLVSENTENAAIISVNNTIYVAGGKINGVLSDQVKKLEF